MEDRLFEIEDNSGDRKYFTLVPNYILNHSTGTAQALYLQLKRLAGESGLAYPSRDYLLKHLHISHPTLIKEFRYLLERGWISYEGLKNVQTSGGMQKLKAYRVVDLWKKNVDYYEGGKKETTPLTKGGKESSKKGVKNRPPNKNTENKNSSISIASDAKDIQGVINLFKEVNPAYSKFFMNKTQRAAVSRLLVQWPRPKLDEIIKVLPQSNAKKYWPKITSPLQLEDNMGKLKALIESERENPKGKQILGL